MANEINASVNVDAARLEAISKVVQEVIQDKAKLLPLVKSFDAAAGMKTMDILYRDPYGRPTTKADNTAVSHTALTFLNDTLTFVPKYVSSKIEDFAKLQSSVEITPQVVEAISESMAREVDYFILDAMKEDLYADHAFDFADSATATNISGDPADGESELSFAEIVEARKLLQQNGKIEMNGEQWMVLSPAQEAVLLNLSEIKTASYYGLATPVQGGNVPSIMGFKVLVSSLLEKEEVVFLDPSAIGFSAQQNFKIEYQRDLENIADHYVGTGVMAAKQLSGGKRIVHILGA